MKNNLINFPDFRIRPLSAMKFAEKNEYMELKRTNTGYRIDIKAGKEYCPLVILRQDDVSVKSLMPKIEIDTNYFSRIMKDRKSFDTLTEFLGKVSRNPFSESLYLVLDDDEIKVDRTDYQDTVSNIDVNFKHEAIMEMISRNRGLIKTDEKSVATQNPTFYAYKNRKKRGSLKRKNLVPLAEAKQVGYNDKGLQIKKWKPTETFSDIFYLDCSILNLGKFPRISENVMKSMNELIKPYSIKMSEFRERPDVEIASNEQEQTEYHPYLSDAQLCHEGEEALEKSFPMPTEERENIKKVKQ